ncbi:MAG: metallophosphoesterase [Flexilinea sp.]
MKKMKISVLLAVTILMASVSLAAGFSSENSTALWEADQTRDKIVVISDIHLGIDNTFSENVQNLPLLIEFLQRLQKTQDVRELVIAGDFLDEWYLPVYYPSYSDSDQFYRDVIANNQDIIDELNNLIASGIKVVYVVGNHDMLLAESVLQEAIPDLVQARDIKGLGIYYTGDRKEIAIEHGHRYDVFSAPDTFSNAELCGNENTILPAGYFYARYAATWVIEGRPKVEKDLPVISEVPDVNNKDQFDAYLYYKVLNTISARMTPLENLDEKIFDMHIAGFDDAYTYLDFYPAMQADGTISAPVLFRNIQRTWSARQEANGVKIANEFSEAVVGAEDWKYFFSQAKRQYLENPEENVDIVVFGHTHVPNYQVAEGGKSYLNTGTWIDHNTSYPDATRTFAVITIGEKDTSALFMYNTDGSIRDISASVNLEID